MHCFSAQYYLFELIFESIRLLKQNKDLIPKIKMAEKQKESKGKIKRWKKIL